MKNLIQTIEELADKYAEALNAKTVERVEEMQGDDNSHYLVYQVLGITDQEGKLIDLYQNKGRFLYKYAGSFLEEAAILCFQYKFPLARKEKVENTLGSRPRTFEIDCLVDNNAYEIKWRDATTDGDHITKEHTRVKVIQGHGYKPIRIMFYYPNRGQAIKIQKTLETLYLGVNGEYIYGDAAWEYIRSTTDVDLKQILTNIAEKKQRERGI
ncbi:ApaLI family restriction endonuclease [Paenibacillus odorifer]|uniref:ApaLI family restriction endonuclease n=1 Tax=Paenibacillus TaxID=44249 RepID=UPI00096D3943|nr:ApaLI family restriction endonuclease [Paenibacillus odorifer]